MILNSLIGLSFYMVIYFAIKIIILNKKQKELEDLKKKYPKRAEEFWTHMAIQSFLDKKINNK